LFFTFGVEKNRAMDVFLPKTNKKEKMPSILRTARLVSIFQFKNFPAPSKTFISGSFWKF